MHVSNYTERFVIIYYLSCHKPAKSTYVADFEQPFLLRETSLQNHYQDAGLKAERRLVS